MHNLINKIIIEEDIVYQKFDKVFCKNRGEVFTAINQNLFNHCYNNKELRTILNDFIIYQEGVGMFILFKVLGRRKTQRIDSTQVLENFTNEIIEKGKSIIFIGGNFEQNEFILHCNKKKLILESYINGFFDLDDINYLNKIIENIKSCFSKFIFIGMGSPKQEILAYYLKTKINDRTFICVGNFINFFLGFQTRAPKFVRYLQLEWLFRLILEPKRLFKRYIFGIPLFLLRIISLKLNYKR